MAKEESGGPIKPKRVYTRGPEHHNWKGGKYRTAKGYVQIRHGEYRGKLEHWAVMHQALKDPIGLTLSVEMLESGEYEVHHVDFVRHHNDLGNLLLLQDVIHHAISGFRKGWNGVVTRGWEDYCDEMAKTVVL